MVEHTDDLDGRGSQAARGFEGAPAALALVALNVLVFATEIGFSRDLLSVLAVPDRTLILFGANASPWTIADSRFETLVTSFFLHASLVHLGLNLAVLRAVGPPLERAIGPVRLLGLYLASGVVASATSAVWARFVMRQSITVGASGAIFGLFGITLVEAVRRQGWRGPLTTTVARSLAAMTLLGVLANLTHRSVRFDNAAHVGGALAGMVLAVAWQHRPTSAGAKRAIIVACAGVLFASGAAVVARDATDPFLFTDVDGRLRAALLALRAHRCDDALGAMKRAAQMDPTNPNIRALGEEIERECAPALGPTSAAN